MDAYELTYCGEVCSYLDNEIARLREESALLKREIAEAGRQFSAENPYGAVYRNAFDVASEAGQHVAEMEKKLGATEKNLAEAAYLEKLRLSPYFGRVDFAEAGESAEVYYIGLRTLFRRADSRFLTYDWRAPVSSLFYAGEVGSAAYAAPGGEVSGEIFRIRQYQFRDGALAACWDADMRIDDAVLRNVLSGASSEKMRTIVSTIQRDQNRAIRADPSRNLAVFGPAGCGKTSVGMHRLAWLLYEARADNRAPDLLMFTANEAFRAYVSGVLPELGEREIRACSYADLFRKYLKGYAVEEALSQTEALLAGNRERERCVCAMYDPAFTAFADGRLTALPARFRTLSLFGDTVIAAADLKEKYGSFPPSMRVGDRLALLKDWARDEIRRYFRVNRKTVFATVMRSTALGESTDAAYRRCKEKFQQNAEAMIDGAVCTDPAVLCRRLFAAYYGENDALEGLKRRLEAKKPRFEEGVFLLYLKAALGLCREKRSPSHILIDEAQDYAPIQHRTIRLLYPGTVFTLLADVNQGIVPAADSLDQAEIAAIYRADAFSIAKSYRNTKQIGEFAKRFLPGADYELFDRDGPAPQFVEAADPAETAAEIVNGLPDACRSVCVILPTAREARRFYAALREYLPGCAAVTDAKTVPSARVLCMPVALTKGMEFDAVILPDFGEVQKNSRVAYMMTTRALHELYLIE